VHCVVKSVLCSKECTLIKDRLKWRKGHSREPLVFQYVAGWVCSICNLALISLSLSLSFISVAFHASVGRGGGRVGVGGRGGSGGGGKHGWGWSRKRVRVFGLNQDRVDEISDLMAGGKISKISIY